MNSFFNGIKNLYLDAKNIKNKDPAASNIISKTPRPLTKFFND